MGQEQLPHITTDQRNAANPPAPIWVAWVPFADDQLSLRTIWLPRLP
jgi:hypothetical protein